MLPRTGCVCDARRPNILLEIVKAWNAGADFVKSVSLRRDGRSQLHQIALRRRFRTSS
jgi:hypothetical protein